ncbi:hypothetical protein FRB95_001833 [Tulasnella sp. JGI-2019a]|nr:hypothetical protein FRB93_003745 [Tulasnella sp. JGI-2019a]KAG9032127.1 hypothetical protein FRB95_001833 [Tulasnella sp. JGI-2019a]
MPIKDYRKFNFGRLRSDRIITIPDSSSDAKADVTLPQGPLHSIVQRHELPHVKWRGWIGTFIADNLNWSLESPWHIDDFPKGYTLVRTARQIEENRYDYHLYGYSKKSVYNSPREFAFHAVWLFWRPYHDEHSCQCTLDTGRNQGYINSIWIGVPGVVRRDRDEDGPATDADRSRARPGERRLVTLPTRAGFVSWIRMKRSLIDGGKSTPPPRLKERDFDLTFTRPYRIGELVWVLIEPLRPSIPNVTDEDDEAITFWPAIVQRLSVKAHPSPSLAAFAPPDGQETAYNVQLLGVENIHKVPFEHILSWHAYALPQSVLHRIQDPHMPVEITSVLIQLAEFHPLPVPPKPPAISRPGFRAPAPRAEIPRTFENALGPLSLAHRKAEFIEERFCATDEYLGFEEDLGERKCYQGLWWGADHIWVDDFVRLTCTRGDLEKENLADRLAPPSRDAQDRPLLARIREIVFDELKNQLCFSAEVFELKKLKQDGARRRDGAAGLPRPPSNYRFRNVTPSEVLIYLPVEIISGRYNPLPIDSEPHRNLLGDMLSDENLDRLGRGELDGTDLGTSLKDVLALSGLCREEGDHIHPSIDGGAVRGRDGILIYATREAKKITYDNWVQRRRRRELDGDGDSVMGD